MSTRAPVLVTGVPRSGTTWLARVLATAHGTALAGREPMNPRGRQYALASTVSGWSRVESPDGRQRRALQLAYHGLNPWVYSRYGRRQWAAPLPWTRLIVKDPFAMLSLPAVSRATGARIVLMYRHPGAVLASYRRMGWVADLEELRPVYQGFRRRFPDSAGPPQDPPAVGADSPAAMGWFWSALYTMALEQLDDLSPVVVSHEEVAGGGDLAVGRLFDALALSWSTRTSAELSGASAQGTAKSSGALHNFDRPPQDVATAWRAKLQAGEVETIEAATDEVRARLEALRLRVL